MPLLSSNLQPMPQAPAPSPVATEVDQLLQRLGVPRSAYTGGDLPVRSPITGESIGTVPQTTPAEATQAIGRAHAAYLAWRSVPAPRRGELVRLLGEELRAAKADLGRLVTLEAGKIPSEGAGEVQEMIDICDFAVGLSRQLYGLTLATERAEHRMMESWHSLGVCGVISAFNFPVAVWSWNATLALVCGDAVVEAVREDPAHRAGHACDRPARAGALRRRARGPAGTADRSARRRRGAGGRPPRGGAVGHRIHRHGAPGGAAAGGAFRARDPGAGRQQRRHRRPLGRPRPDAARHRLRRDGHGRTALHHAAPPFRARQRIRRAGAAAGQGLRRRAGGRPAHAGHAGGTADRRRRLRGHAEGAA